MFIVSKRNFKLHLADGSVYRIQKDFMGEVPGYVLEQPLIKAALKDGSIVVPAGQTDKALDAAVAAAAAKEAKNDIRPDAVAAEASTTAAEAAEAAEPKSRARKK